jgi:hypothetical protein
VRLLTIEKRGVPLEPRNSRFLTIEAFGTTKFWEFLNPKGTLM